jgi:hypothetical protein
MKRNSRNVIFQAPLGVGCAVMLAPPFVVAGVADSASSDASHGSPARQLRIFRETRTLPDAAATTP